LERRRRNNQTVATKAVTKPGIVAVTRLRKHSVARASGGYARAIAPRCKSLDLIQRSMPDFAIRRTAISRKHYRRGGIDPITCGRPRLASGFSDALNVSAACGHRPGLFFGAEPSPVALMKSGREGSDQGFELCAGYRIRDVLRRRSRPCRSSCLFRCLFRPRQTENSRRPLGRRRALPGCSVRLTRRLPRPFRRHDAGCGFGRVSHIKIS